VFVGVPPVSANATSTVALWPGSLAAAFAYRRELVEVRRWLVGLGVMSALGGVLGAVLLLHTPNRVFMHILPLLLLLAALIFSFSKRITARFRGASARMPGGRRASAILGGLVQLVIASYGGYFGGGMGIMMLAAFSVMGMSDIHVMNSLKSALAVLINLVAIAVFVSKGAVAPQPALVMVAAGTAGGYLGAFTAKKVDPAWVRRFVLFVAWAMTAYFTWRAYS
jgi:uncharacterized membrane protein YfcA